MIKFNLTQSELTKLRAICKVTKLSFNAMAARPRVARELISKYKWTNPNEHTR